MSMTPYQKAALDRWILEPPELEEEGPSEYCDSPGRGGCGCCPGCQEWGDMKFEEKQDREMEERG
jgi:hypothetical protein